MTARGLSRTIPSGGILFCHRDIAQKLPYNTEIGKPREPSMIEATPSRTALVTALMRAAHTRRDPSPLIDDPWGDRLVPKSERDRVSERILARMEPDARAAAQREPVSLLDNYFLANTTYPGVVMRSRYAEDALQAATKRGTRQYVLIGAGFDSFALRRPAFSESLEIFEIDHPATQALKLERIRECGVTLPPSVHFIAADLANETLASALGRSSFRASEPAFFSWLGVTVYLTREANMATLRAVATGSASGSELVFTYVDQIEFADGGRRSPEHPNAQAVARLGEPYMSGFDPRELANDLKQAGLDLVENLNGHQLAERYGRTSGHPLRPSASMHIALARCP
jgi:methyltransferase (TIGR00027 family)